MRRRILPKKIGREMWQNRAQFVAIFLMLLVSALVYVGVFAYIEGMSVAGEKYFREQKLPDLVVEAEEVSEKELEAVRKLDGVKLAERVATLDGEAVSPDEVKVRIKMQLIEENQLSKLYVVKGEEFSQNDGVWLDSKLAEKRGWRVGEKIRMKSGEWSLEKEIKGLVMSPDKVYDLESDNQVFATHETYGFLYVLAKEVKGLQVPFRKLMIGLEDGWEVARVEKEVKKLFSKAVVIRKEETKSYRIYENEKREGVIYIAVFSGLFLVIAVLTAMSTIGRLVQKQRREIGILKALGIKDGRIAWYYASFGWWPAFWAVVIALVMAPMTISKYFLGLLDTTFAIPAMEPRLPMVVLVISIIIVSGMGILAGLICLRELRRPVVDILKGEGLKKQFYQLPKIMSRCSFTWRWNLREVLQNKLRTIVGMVGVSGAVMMIVCGLGLVDTMNGYLNWQFEELANYKYRMKLEERMNEETIREIFEKYGSSTTMNLVVEVDDNNGDGEDGQKKVELVVDDAGGLVGYTNEKRMKMELERGEGLYLSMKLMKEMGLQENKKVRWRIVGREGWQESEIVGVIRKPQNQNMVMRREYFEKKGEKYYPNFLYCQDCLRDEAELSKGVNSVKKLTEERKDFEKMMRIMQGFAKMMMATAVGLSVVIVYSLGTITLTEKRAEYTTLSVLGFRGGRIARIFRQQNNLMTLVAMMMGLPLGRVMLEMIFGLAMGKEWDFVPEVKMSSYVLAAVLVGISAGLTGVMVSRKISRKEFSEKNLRRTE